MKVSEYMTKIEAITVKINQEKSRLTKEEIVSWGEIRDGYVELILDYVGELEFTVEQMFGGLTQ